MNNVGLRLSPVRRAISCCWKRRRLVRAVHQLRELPYNLDDGLGDFLPPPALKTVAVDFQRGLLERLNDEVRGTEEANKSVAQTVINTAAHRSKTLAFNYASLALNNSFFLDMLKPPSLPPSPTHEASITPYMRAVIRTEHGSLDQLKSNFSAAALGMASSGWVWFVADNNGRTVVLPTFGAGTLLVRSRANISPIHGPIVGEDVERWKAPSSFESTPAATNTAKRPSRLARTTTTTPSTASPTSQTSSSPRSLHTSTPALSSPLDELDTTVASLFGDHAPKKTYPSSFYTADARTGDNITNLGEMLYPLFCISIHEHAWMSAGYGVWGKEEWLKRFWTVLDWEKVCKTYAHFAPDRQAI